MYSPFDSVCGPLVTPSLILSLERREKRKNKREARKINKPPADLIPVQLFLLVFLCATGRGGLGVSFLLLYGLMWVGSRSEP